MGIGGWMGVVLNSATATVPIMVLTLVVASAMHLFSHYIRLSSEPGGAALAATTALNTNVVPIAMTAFTSAASLLSLTFISSPPVRDVGILAAIGMLVGGIFAVTLSPLLLNTGMKSQASLVNDHLQRLLNRYARYVSTRGKAHVALTFTLAIMAVGLTQLSIDDDFVAYLSPSTEVRQDTDFTLRELSGPSHVEIHVKAKESIFNPASISDLLRLTEQARGLKVVSSASSLTDVLHNVSLAFGETRALPDLSEAALSQFFFAYELGLRAGDSASDLVNEDLTETHITLLLNSTLASEVRKIEELVETWKNNYENVDFWLTGENSPVANLSSSNIPAVIFTVITTLALTSIGLALYFKNWRMGLNTLCAITIPIICGLGAWGWLSDSIGLAGTIVIAVALGIVIDDAIHLMYQQHQSILQGENAWQSTAYSIHRVGVPIVATTAIFLLGMSPLLLSDFQVNITFASVTCLILAVSLAFDLGSLPPLMAWAGKKTSDDRR